MMGVRDLVFAQLNLAGESWKTLVIQAEGRCGQPSRRVWDSWAVLEDWPKWSSRLHPFTQWEGDPGWRVNGQFEQDRRVGLPFGIQISTETILRVEEGRMVLWGSSLGGVSSFQAWLFEDVPEGGCRVETCEVFHGTVVGIFKRAYETEWLKMYSESLNGLLEWAARPPRDTAVK